MKLKKINARGVNNLYRNVETDVIYFRKHSKGREVQKSCKTKNLEEAKVFAEEIQRAEFGPSKKSKARSTALEFYDFWISRKESANKSSATIASIRATRNHIAPYFKEMMPEDVTAEWWESTYIPEVRERTHANRKFMNDRKWVSSFLKQLVADGALAKKPILINPDAASEAGKVYTDSEVGALVTNAQNEDLRLAVEMAATMGMRRLEIFGLKSDRVDVAAGVIRLRAVDTKTRKARAFSISPSTLERIVARAKAGPYVFPSEEDANKPLHKDGFRRSWKSLKRIVGVTGRFHDLRHTFLTKAFKAPGANPALICWYAGLSLEVATRIYLHLDERDTHVVSSLVTYA